jgi:hypothetical protein
MPLLADKISFAERHIVNKEGVKFSLKGRDWVREEFWRPADGFKLWLPDTAAASDVCEDCRGHIGEIIEHPGDNVTRSKIHAKTKCPGLDAAPIIVTVLNLERQGGKTFGSMAYALATIFKSRNKSIAGLWASEDQGTRIFRETYEEAILRSEALKTRCEINGVPPRLWIPATKSRFEVLAASHASITGRSRTHILVDEARDLDPRVVMALIPSIFAMQGLECPSGHVSLDKDTPNPPAVCSACGARIMPWFGRLILTSSSGVVDPGGGNFFAELIDHLREEPNKNFHLFATDKQLNPRRSTVVVNAIESVFGRLESTKEYAEAEIGNRWTRKGEEVVSKADLNKCIDRSIRFQGTECADPCVAFLDTSDFVEKTSLVIVAHDSTRSTEPWDCVWVPKVEWWDPATTGGIIDTKAVMLAVQGMLTLYPRLVACWVDVRGRPWAMGLVKNLRSNKVKAWTENTMHESDSGWLALAGRIRAGSIRIPNCDAMIKEFSGVQLKRIGQTPRVADIDRRKCHKDITESLALCCYLVAKEKEMRRISLSDLRKRQLAIGATAKAHALVGDVAARARAAEKRDREKSSGKLENVSGQNFGGQYW